MGKTKIDHIVTSDRSFCYVTTYELYVKEVGGSFEKWTSNQKATPYIFDTSSGKLDVDFSHGINDQVLKIKGIFESDSIETNEFSIKAYCAVLAVNPITVALLS